MTGWIVIVIVNVSFILGSRIQKDAIFFFLFVNGDFHLPVWTKMTKNKSAAG